MGCGSSKSERKVAPESQEGLESESSEVSSWLQNATEEFDVPVIEEEPVTIREACINPSVIAALSAKIKKIVKERRVGHLKYSVTGGLDVPELKLFFCEFAMAHRPLSSSRSESSFVENENKGHLGYIELDDFKVICGLLNLDHTETEIEKIFRIIDMETDNRQDNKVDFDQFVKGVTRGNFLKCVMGDPYVVKPFKIPSNYDYTKSTNDNYANRNTREFVGDFVAIREKLDYNYHVNYTPKRQLWQDAVIKSTVIKTQPQTQPWIVYTCGPMGTGKGYSLSWMSENGCFPLENIVHIDPDYFKSVMSEWRGYRKQERLTPDVKPGSMCHRESGFMQEIAQEAALQMSQNIWVDGSLRDGPWFKEVFLNLRKKYPMYRIAIFYVYASEKIIRDRIKSREQATGRGVPEQELVDSLQAPDKSLGLLVPFVDFVARINNDGNVPRLVAFESVDRTGAWLAIRKRFAKTQASQVEFPNRLAPLFISPADFPAEAILLTHEMKEVLSNFGGRNGLQIEMDMEVLREKIPALRSIRSTMLPETLVSTLSPPFPVNADTDTRLLAGVPGEAFSFAYCYGAHNFGDIVRRASVVNQTAALSFLLNGGFVYFDLKQEIVGCTAVRTVATNSLLHFGKCTELTSEQTNIMNSKMESRFQECTLQFMQEKGCSKYAFICPGETFGSNCANYSGGFAYKFRQGSRYRDRIFPIVSAC